MSPTPTRLLNAIMRESMDDAASEGAEDDFSLCSPPTSVAATRAASDGGDDDDGGSAREGNLLTAMYSRSSGVSGSTYTCRYKERSVDKKKKSDSPINKLWRSQRKECR